MNEAERKSVEISWEEAIEILRLDPAHKKLIFDSYLTADLDENCRRFCASGEFAEVLNLLKAHARHAETLLDIPGGNGIATIAFVRAGFAVTVVEPDPSPSVGRGAIEKVLEGAGLHADVIDAYGENLPFPAASFDVVYVRQGLHHAADLTRALSEYSRVLRPDGVLLACREHVVDDYGMSLKAFLDSQPDHQLYGGENAFTLVDYRSAIKKAGLIQIEEWDPFDSVINLSPGSPESLRCSILTSRPGGILSRFLPDPVVVRVGLWWLRRKRQPGRIYSFMAKKPGRRS
jgi:SAM-dependent methyltransferase